MTRKEYLARKKRRRQIQLIRRCILAGSILLTAIVFIFIVTRIASCASKDNETSKNQSHNAAPTPEQSQPGDATKKKFAGENTTTGWVSDETGSRYFPDVKNFYANGWKEIDNETYYFDKDGYILTGWHTIEEKSCFFDKAGKLQPFTEPKLIALTYDDGPSTHTSYLLDALEEYNAKATFFMVGNRTTQYRDTVKRMEFMGMEVASHTYDHDKLTALDAAGIKETMDKTDEALLQLIGHKAVLMRPVGGSINETVKATVTQPIITWNVDTKDWQSRDAESVAEIIMQNVSDGCIILMHDLYQPTLEATKKVLPLLTEQGYQMVTVSELAKAKGIELQPGVVYNSFPKAAVTPTATPSATPTPTEAAKSEE